MSLARLALPCVAAACAACDGGSPMPDPGGVDAPDGPCGADRLVAGQLVDFDSTRTQLQAVSDARFSVTGMSSRSTTTTTDGRFDPCVPGSRAAIFDVDAPSGYLDGKAYVELEALSGAPMGLRTLTQLRASSLYNFDPTRGHILVFVTA